MTYDFVNDNKLSGVSPAILERMQKVQQARTDAGCTAKNGRTYRTIEKKEFVDAIYNWHAEGKPSNTLPKLKVREAQLRTQGLY